MVYCRPCSPVGTPSHVGFTIYVPLEGVSPIRDTSSQQPELKGGTETILLVEDEDEVRTALKEVLVKFGYTVLEAANGEEAVRLFEKRHADVDLLISDIMMPEKDGKRAYREMLSINPGLKALFMSGYARETAGDEEIRSSGMVMLNKPVMPRDILAKIREILDP